MFRKRRQDSLPTSTNVAPSVFHMPHFQHNSSNGNQQQQQNIDGSGRAIHMEAPLARAWKKASTYTRGTYYCLAFCFFMAYFGYRWLRWNHGACETNRKQNTLASIKWCLIIGLMNSFSDYFEITYTFLSFFYMYLSMKKMYISTKIFSIHPFGMPHGAMHFPVDSPRLERQTQGCLSTTTIDQSRNDEN